MFFSKFFGSLFMVFKEPYFKNDKKLWLSKNYELPENYTPKNHQKHKFCQKSANFTLLFG